jgi:hypothetical protein
MLIRLLGQEEIALSGEYAHPFTDVPGWADQYVGYLYENGLTKGISETLFGANNVCDVRMYTTFVLRALGYDDAAGDFKFENAVDFGSQVGIVDSFLASGTFLRDNMVAISLLGLKAQPADESFDTLLHKLVADGAVSAQTAQPILDRFAAYDEYAAAVIGYGDLQKMEVAVKMLMDMIIGDEMISTVTDMNMKIIVEDDNLLFAVTGSAKVDEETVKMEMYYKDGYLYMNIDGEKVKMEASMDSDAVTVQLGGPLELSVDPFYMIRDIQKTTVNGKTAYTIIFSLPSLSSLSDLGDTLGGDLDVDLDLDFDLDISMEIEDIVVKVIINEDGSLSSMVTSMTMNASVTENGETTSLSYKYEITMDILAVGDKVSITFPSDLSTYPLLSMESLMF